MTPFKRVRGMRDFLPKEAEMLNFIGDKARRLAQLYGYSEIITPILESYELLAVKAGEEIRSRMYAFKDLGGRKVALRPEFTASVARLVATTLRNEPKPLRLFSVGSLYRYDEPQRGRFREFWQSNYELMGTCEPEADAEILVVTNNLMKSVGLKNFLLKVGHVGVLREILSQENVEERIQNAIMQLMDKKQYDEALRLVGKAGTSDRCLTTLGKLVKLRGRRVSDVLNKMESQVERYEKASDAVGNLRDILDLISLSGEKVDMIVEAGFARGLEYYTGLIFEVYTPELDIALGGGGRYDKLIELFGGEPTPAVGVAHGLDRMMLAKKKQKTSLKAKVERKVVVIPVKRELKGEMMRISRILREADMPVEIEVMGRKVSKALEDADRRNIDYAIILGERELKKGTVVLRDLKKREQKTVETEKIVEIIKE